MSVTTGTLAALTGPNDDSRFLRITAPVQPGNSGGPLLDQRGDVIGIVTSRLASSLGMVLAGVAPENVNFAIKTVVIDSFLDAHHIAHAGARAAPLAGAVAIGAEARKFTVEIMCEG